MGGSQSKQQAVDASPPASEAPAAAAEPAAPPPASSAPPPPPTPTDGGPKDVNAADSVGGGGEGGGGGCPMKRSGGGGGGSWGSMFGRRNPHLPTADGRPGLPTTTAAADATANASTPAQQQPPEPSGCPVKGGGGGGGTTQYNVYSQPIDPTNQMPAVANQLPSPGQKDELSTERVRSTIPKGGANDGTTWTYPSPQMFYNSLSRKNKLGDTTEEDITPVVALHNNMNEKTWGKVLEWEAVLDPPPPTTNPAESAGGGRGSDTYGPKLLRFLGRPSDLSPKARFKNWVLGHPLPFDRHDWTILRPDGTEVRYVIDYYHDDTRASEEEGSGLPDMHDRDAVGSILVDVRPALDGPGLAMGRAVVMPYARRVAHSTAFEPLPLQPTAEMREQVGESVKVWENIQENERRSRERAVGGTKREEGPKTIVVARDDDDEDQVGGVDVKISAEEATALAKSFSSMLRQCQEAQEALDRCTDDAEAAKASLALTMCMAKIVCPLQHDAVTKSLAADVPEDGDSKAAAEYDARVDAALENVAACVAGSSERAAMARMVHPEVFAKEDGR